MRCDECSHWGRLNYLAEDDLCVGECEEITWQIGGEIDVAVTNCDFFCANFEKKEEDE